MKFLFAHSWNHCFFAGPPRACEEELTNRKWKRVQGQIAHIKGEKPGSARYDPDQSEKERQCVDNLMLLCPNHHKLIDDLEPDAYPVAMLVKMRDQHVERAQDACWRPSEAEQTAFAREAIEDAVRAASMYTAPPTVESRTVQQTARSRIAAAPTVTAEDVGVAGETAEATIEAPAGQTTTGAVDRRPDPG